MIRVVAVFVFLVVVGLVGCRNEPKGAKNAGAKSEGTKNEEAKNEEAKNEEAKNDVQVAVPSEGANENWWLEYQEVLGHLEADLLVRHGSINNLGFGWPQNFTPFSGASTPMHTFPWRVNPMAAQGTDRIFVVSSYRGNAPAGIDGYTQHTARPFNYPVPIPIAFTPPKFPLHSAVLQVFVDDFQSPRMKSRFLATMNGWRVPEFEAILNSLDQHGPIGKLLTYKLPAEVVKTLETGFLIICIDDPMTGAGDGFAYDFFRLLINPRGGKYRGTLTGRVTDETTGKPVAEAIVSAGGMVTTQTAADGTYKLHNVPAGLATLMFSGKGYQRKTINTDLLAGESKRVDARLMPVTLEFFLQEEAAFQPQRVIPLNEPIRKTTGEKEMATKLNESIRKATGKEKEAGVVATKLDRLKFKAQLIQHEGKQKRIHQDDRGNLVIGVGFNLTRLDANSRLRAIGVDDEKILTGEKALTEEQIDALLAADIDRTLADCKAIFPAFPELADSRQRALADMMFNLGRTRFVKFQAMIASVNKADFNAAADELKRSVWYEQAKDRSRTLETMLRTGRDPLSPKEPQPLGGLTAPAPR